MSTTYEFQAETKRMLQLMINSIYTNREIFLRELISNASDAIDKLRFAALTETNLVPEDTNYEIFLVPDQKNKTLTISDNGIGMTQEELIANIGTIAKSGTKEFIDKLQNHEHLNATELIGQFGVGFYSAFMVADKITLLTKKAGTDLAFKWESTGDGKYNIEPASKESCGTTITLHLKEEHTLDSNNEQNYLNQQTLQTLVKKYSDYIRFPIKMLFDIPVQESDSVETKQELKILNSMAPLWTKNKNDIKPDEYNQLYKHLFLDWQDPLDVIHTRAEGVFEYTTLLYIPEHAPYDFYQKEHTTGIKLYSKNVFIMDDCRELLPEYLRFVKGIIDTPDVSLNISREILQQNQTLKKIGKNLEKTILKNLEVMLKNSRDKYLKFFKEFGKAIKHGIYADYSSHEKLRELLLFPSSRSVTEDSLITLAEYVANMKPEQDVIYYATGKDRQAIDSLPQIEVLKEKGLEILYFLDRVDEFAIDMLAEYAGKKFQSISRGQLDLSKFETEQDKASQDKLINENKDLLEAIKNALTEKVDEVRISNRLKSSPVCLISSDSGISISMEQILADVQDSKIKATKILELNPNHEIFKTLKRTFEVDAQSEQFVDYCKLLYGQATLLEGLTVENPVDFAKLIAKLMK